MKINDVLPNLAFTSYHQGKITPMAFSDFAEKWLVVMFYPGDFTSVCPTELKEAAARYPDLIKMKTQLISFSTDSAETHQAWQTTNPALKAIEFPMGADRNGTIARAFDVYLDATGEAQRSTFIFNPKGQLMAMETHHNDIGRSISEIIRKLQALQYVAGHWGEMCPASWTKGQPTLTV